MHQQLTEGEELSDELTTSVVAECILIDSERCRMNWKALFYAQQQQEEEERRKKEIAAMDAVAENEQGSEEEQQEQSQSQGMTDPSAQNVPPSALSEDVLAAQPTETASAAANVPSTLPNTTAESSSSSSSPSVDSPPPPPPPPSLESLTEKLIELTVPPDPPTSLRHRIKERGEDPNVIKEIAREYCNRIKKIKRTPKKNKKKRGKRRTGMGDAHLGGRKAEEEDEEEEMDEEEVVEANVSDDEDDGDTTVSRIESVFRLSAEDLAKAEECAKMLSQMQTHLHSDESESGAHPEMQRAASTVSFTSAAHSPQSGASSTTASVTYSFAPTPIPSAQTPFSITPSVTPLPQLSAASSSLTSSSLLAPPPPVYDASYPFLGGIILDGFPQNALQAAQLERLLTLDEHVHPAIKEIETAEEEERVRKEREREEREEEREKRLGHPVIPKEEVAEPQSELSKRMALLNKELLPPAGWAEDANEFPAISCFDAVLCVDSSESDCISRASDDGFASVRKEKMVWRRRKGDSERERMEKEKKEKERKERAQQGLDVELPDTFKDSVSTFPEHTLTPSTLTLLHAQYNQFRTERRLFEKWYGELCGCFDVIPLSLFSSPRHLKQHVVRRLLSHLQQKLEALTPFPPMQSLDLIPVPLPTEEELDQKAVKAIDEALDVLYAPPPPPQPAEGSEQAEEKTGKGGKLDTSRSKQGGRPGSSDKSLGGKGKTAAKGKTGKGAKAEKEEVDDPSLLIDPNEDEETRKKREEEAAQRNAMKAADRAKRIDVLQKQLQEERERTRLLQLIEAMSSSRTAFSSASEVLTMRHKGGFPLLRTLPRVSSKVATLLLAEFESSEKQFDQVIGGAFRCLMGIRSLVARILSKQARHAKEELSRRDFRVDGIVTALQSSLASLSAFPLALRSHPLTKEEMHLRLVESLSAIRYIFMKQRSVSEQRAIHLASFVSATLVPKLTDLVGLCLEAVATAEITRIINFLRLLFDYCCAIRGLPIDPRDTPIIPQPLASAAAEEKKTAKDKTLAETSRQEVPSYPPYTLGDGVALFDGAVASEMESKYLRSCAYPDVPAGEWKDDGETGSGTGKDGKKGGQAKKNTEKAAGGAGGGGKDKGAAAAAAAAAESAEQELREAESAFMKLPFFGVPFVKWVRKEKIKGKTEKEGEKGNEAILLLNSIVSSMTPNNGMEDILVPPTTPTGKETKKGTKTGASSSSSSSTSSSASSSSGGASKDGEEGSDRSSLAQSLQPFAQLPPSLLKEQTLSLLGSAHTVLNALESGIRAVKERREAHEREIEEERKRKEAEEREAAEASERERLASLQSADGERPASSSGDMPKSPKKDAKRADLTQRGKEKDSTAASSAAGKAGKTAKGGKGKDAKLEEAEEEEQKPAPPPFVYPPLPEKLASLCRINPHMSDLCVSYSACSSSTGLVSMLPPAITFDVLSNNPAFSSSSSASASSSAGSQQDTTSSVSNASSISNLSASSASSFPNSQISSSLPSSSQSLPSSSQPQKSPFTPISASFFTAAERDQTCLQLISESRTRMQQILHQAVTVIHSCATACSSLSEAIDRWSRQKLFRDLQSLSTLQFLFGIAIEEGGEIIREKIRIRGGRVLIDRSETIIESREGRDDDDETDEDAATFLIEQSRQQQRLSQQAKLREHAHSGNDPLQSSIAAPEFTEHWMKTLLNRLESGEMSGEGVGAFLDAKTGLFRAIDAEPEKQQGSMEGQELKESDLIFNMNSGTLLDISSDMSKSLESERRRKAAQDAKHKDVLREFKAVEKKLAHDDSLAVSTDAASVIKRERSKMRDCSAWNALKIKSSVEQKLKSKARGDSAEPGSHRSDASAAVAVVENGSSPGFADPFGDVSELLQDESELDMHDEREWDDNSESESDEGESPLPAPSPDNSSFAEQHSQMSPRVTSPQHPLRASMGAITPITPDAASEEKPTRLSQPDLRYTRIYSHWTDPLHAHPFDTPSHRAKRNALRWVNTEKDNERERKERERIRNEQEKSLEGSAEKPQVGGSLRSSTLKSASSTGEKPVATPLSPRGILSTHGIATSLSSSTSTASLIPLRPPHPLRTPPGIAAVSPFYANLLRIALSSLSTTGLCHPSQFTRVCLECINGTDGFVQRAFEQCSQVPVSHERNPFPMPSPSKQVAFPAQTPSASSSSGSSLSVNSSVRIGSPAFSSSLLTPRVNFTTPSSIPPLFPPLWRFLPVSLIQKLAEQLCCPFTQTLNVEGEMPHQFNKQDNGEQVCASEVSEAAPAVISMPPTQQRHSFSSPHPIEVTHPSFSSNAILAVSPSLRNSVSIPSPSRELSPAPITHSHCDWRLFIVGLILPRPASAQEILALSVHYSKWTDFNGRITRRRFATLPLFFEDNVYSFGKKREKEKDRSRSSKPHGKSKNSWQAKQETKPDGADEREELFAHIDDPVDADAEWTEEQMRILEERELDGLGHEGDEISLLFGERKKKKAEFSATSVQSSSHNGDLNHLIKGRKGDEPFDYSKMYDENERSMAPQHPSHGVSQLSLAATPSSPSVRSIASYTSTAHGSFGALRKMASTKERLLVRQYPVTNETQMKMLLFDLFSSDYTAPPPPMPVSSGAVQVQGSTTLKAKDTLPVITDDPMTPTGRRTNPTSTASASQQNGPASLTPLTPTRHTNLSSTVTPLNSNGLSHTQTVPRTRRSMKLPANGKGGAFSLPSTTVRSVDPAQILAALSLDYSSVEGTHKAFEAVALFQKLNARRRERLQQKRVEALSQALNIPLEDFGSKYVNFSASLSASVQPSPASQNVNSPYGSPALPQEPQSSITPVTMSPSSSALNRTPSFSHMAAAPIVPSLCVSLPIDKIAELLCPCAALPLSQRERARSSLSYSYCRQTIISLLSTIRPSIAPEEGSLPCLTWNDIVQSESGSRLISIASRFRYINFREIAIAAGAFGGR